MKVAKPFQISRNQVWKAYQEVKLNGGSAGIDQQSLEEFEVNLKGNLYKIWNRMSSGSYFPPPVKAVPIPKKSGGFRILGIPSVSDRVAQAVVKNVLEPVLDPIFDENSFGFRPNKSAHQAMRLLNPSGKQLCQVRPVTFQLVVEIVRSSRSAGTTSRELGAFWTPSINPMVVIFQVYPQILRVISPAIYPAVVSACPLRPSGNMRQGQAQTSLSFLVRIQPIKNLSFIVGLQTIQLPLLSP